MSGGRLSVMEMAVGPTGRVQTEVDTGTTGENGRESQNRPFYREGNGLTGYQCTDFFSSADVHFGTGKAMNNGDLKTERLLTRRELAEYLRVSEDSVDRWRKYADLPYLKLPGRCVRFRLSDVEQWIGKHEN